MFGRDSRGRMREMELEEFRRKHQDNTLKLIQGSITGLWKDSADNRKEMEVLKDRLKNLEDAVYEIQNDQISEVLHRDMKDTMAQHRPVSEVEAVEPEPRPEPEKPQPWECDTYVAPQPCPWCGTIPEVKKLYDGKLGDWVYMRYCAGDCHYYAGKRCGSLEEATESWNEACDGVFDGEGKIVVGEPKESLPQRESVPDPVPEPPVHEAPVPRPCPICGKEPMVKCVDGQWFCLTMGEIPEENLDYIHDYRERTGLYPPCWQVYHVGEDDNHNIHNVVTNSVFYARRDDAVDAWNRQEITVRTRKRDEHEDDDKEVTRVMGGWVPEDWGKEEFIRPELCPYCDGVPLVKRTFNAERGDYDYTIFCRHGGLDYHYFAGARCNTISDAMRSWNNAVINGHFHSRK